MAMLRFLLRSAGPTSLLMGLLSVVSGAFNAGLVAAVHQTLVHGASGALITALLALGLGKVASGYFAGVLLTEYSLVSIAALRRELIAKLLGFPYARFERMGRQRVYASLTEDVSVINAALQTLPSFVVSLAVVAGGCAYLLYLSPFTFVALAALGVVSGAAHRMLGVRARASLLRARTEHDRLFGHFRAVTEGTKELKQHAERRRAFLETNVAKTNDALLEHHVAGHTRFALAQAVGGLASLAALALILFVLPRVGHGLSGAAMSGYVLTSLYLMGPLGNVLRIAPFFAQADIARKRIEELGTELGRQAIEATTTTAAPASFDEVRLVEVTRGYRDERSTTTFTLGPLSLSLVPREIVFVTGDNGSGKSTFAKVLLGLYEPDAGELRWNGTPVTAENRDAYRQLFSAVHADYYLFDSLLGLGDDALDARARTLLDKLGLAERVRVDGGELSSLDLSQGQRRRLSLLTAYLEDRPIYVFDEWAADQDPSFKELFYRELLPELRARGKAVVVITHDDRYFDVADRRIHLQRGRVAPVT